MIIKLTPDEMREASRIAKERVERNHYTGGMDLKRDATQSAYAATLAGTLGEFAFCKRYNLFPDLTTHPRIGGADCIDRDGNSVDVKTTDRPDGRLLVEARKKGHDVARYGLVIGPLEGRQGEYRVVGVIQREKLFIDSKKQNFGYGDNYVAEQHELEE